MLEETANHIVIFADDEPNNKSMTKKSLDFYDQELSHVKEFLISKNQ